MRNHLILAALTLIMAMLIAYILIADKQSERWYSITQTEQGQVLFGQHCASCHGLKAQGLVADWKHRDASGFLPPPPLDGSAHAWHHGMPKLLEIIQQGGSLYDGTMPAFADVLNAQEQLAVVAYFQSHWNDQTFRLWQADRKLPIIPPPPPQKNS